MEELELVTHLLDFLRVGDTTILETELPAEEGSLSDLYVWLHTFQIFSKYKYKGLYLVN